MAANVFADIKEYLLADSTIANRVSDRIYNSEFPRNLIKTDASRIAPCLVLRGVGGILTPDLTPFGDGRVDVYTYAADHDIAQEVDLLVYDVLERMNGYGSVNYVSPGGWVYPIPEDGTGRRGLFRSFIIHTFRHGRARIGE